MPQKRRPPKKKNVEKSFSSSASFFSGAALNWESRVEEISAEIFIDRERANGNRGKRGNSKTTARSIFSFCCHVVPFTSIASLFLQFMLPEKKSEYPEKPHNYSGLALGHGHFIQFWCCYKNNNNKSLFLHWASVRETVGIIFYVIFIAYFTSSPGLVSMRCQKLERARVKRTPNWWSNHKINCLIHIGRDTFLRVGECEEEESIDKYLKRCLLSPFVIKYILYDIETRRKWKDVADNHEVKGKKGSRSRFVVFIWLNL